jgi:hypothetical protein
MLKFSGYSYLIRGQPFRSWGFYGGVATKLPVRGENYYAEVATAGPHTIFRGRQRAAEGRHADPQRQAELEG